MFLLHILGILQTSPALYYALQLVAILAIGLDFVPTGAMNMEVMDYEIYKNGRDRSALVHATSNFLGKIQSAVSSSIVGFLLIAVGYEVDSVTDTFLGQLSDVPNMSGMPMLPKKPTAMPAKCFCSGRRGMASAKRAMWLQKRPFIDF